MLIGLPILLGLTLGASERRWEEVAKTDGVTVSSRVGESENLAEVRGVGLIDAPPTEVWRALRDYPNYPKTMPYTEEAKILGIEEQGRITYFYSVVNAPLVDRRDYVTREVDESAWEDGRGFFLLTWTAWPHGPAERPGHVRVRLNDGYWRLEPREGGTKTFATCYMLTDPGGSIPRWVANRVNRSAVPELFAAIRKAAVTQRASEKSTAPLTQH